MLKGNDTFAKCNNLDGDIKEKGASLLHSPTVNLDHLIHIRYILPLGTGFGLVLVLGKIIYSLYSSFAFP